MESPKGRPDPRRPIRALNIVMVAGLVLVGLLGLWLYSRRDKILTLARMAIEMRNVMRESVNAPGAADLRALGCNRGDITDMRRIQKVVGTPDADAEGGLFVACSIRFRMREPTCDEVAATYVAAVGSATEEFTAMVRREETNQILCQFDYAPDGSRL